MNKAREKWNEWRMEREYNRYMASLTRGGGAGSWWVAVKEWVAARPKRSPCPHCGTAVWHMALGHEVYCSETCAYYGPAQIEGFECEKCGYEIKSGLVCSRCGYDNIPF